MEIAIALMISYCLYHPVTCDTYPTGPIECMQEKTIKEKPESYENI